MWPSPRGEVLVTIICAAHALVGAGTQAGVHVTVTCATRCIRAQAAARLRAGM